MVAVDNARAGMAGSYILDFAVTTKNVGNLESYRAKRKADRTPEPFGAALPGGQRFVVQQHAARRTHYDFRLEFDGVLKSWAVPKGPSPNPADKRLAVHVEDHPVDYVNFEGVIPPDNYGAGAVIVWDRGRWIALNDIAAGFDKGKLLFELRGHKLRGRWTLVKTKRGKNEWLLIKERDAYATSKSTEDYPHDSVLSGRTVEQVASGRSARRGSRRAAAQARRRAARAARARLEADARDAGQAVLGSALGVRAQVRRLSPVRREARRRGQALLARRPRLHGDVSRRSPRSSRRCRSRSSSSTARSSCSTRAACRASRCCKSAARLTRRADVARAALELPASIYAFDLLAFDGFDLRALPLVERKAALRALLPVVGRAALLRALR